MTIMYKNIILSSCVFGSIYILSTSLKLINKNMLFTETINYKIFIFNGLIFSISGSIFLYGVNSLK